MPPAVPEARQLGLAFSRVVLDRDLGDLELLLRRPDHHLRGELHPRRAQIELGQHVSSNRPHPAVRVSDACAEEEVQHPGEHGVADVAVVPRHRAGLDVVHSVAHDELGAAVELGDEARNVGEVVRQVGVRHDDVVTSRRVEAGEIGTAVASTALVDDPCPCTLGELCASVRRAVVSDDDLAVEAVSVAARPSASVTQRSIEAASFRHGMTIEMKGPPSTRSGSFGVCSGRCSRVSVGAVIRGRMMPRSY